MVGHRLKTLLGLAGRTSPGQALVGRERLLQLTKFLFLDNTDAIQPERGFLSAGILAYQPFPFLDRLAVMRLNLRGHLFVRRLVFVLKLLRQRVFDLSQREKNLTRAPIERMILEKLVEVLPCDPVILCRHRIQADLELRVDDARLASRPLCAVRKTRDVFAPLLDRALVFLLLKPQQTNHIDRLAGPLLEGLVARNPRPDLRIHRRFLRHESEILLARESLVGRDRIIGLTGVPVGQRNQARGIRCPRMARMILNETPSLLDAAVPLARRRVWQIVSPHQQPVRVRFQGFVLLVSQLQQVLGVLAGHLKLR